MVGKKYLCAAPRPESWEEKAEALLKSLGGDKVKRERVARQTLSMLKERHKHEKKRTGPGRKSNAEHAIAFYEYLVGDKQIDDKEDNDDDNAPSGDDHENSSSDESSSSSSSSSSKTIDTEEFLEQHDDACDVCNSGGELICCSTCTLVFHKECIRPVVKSIPSDWSCPHCITQGIKNYKRHSKTWKAAASGVRQMNKMKTEFQSGSNVQKGKESIEGENDEGHTDKTSAEESKDANTAKSTQMKSSTNDDMASLNDDKNDEEKNEEDPTSKNLTSEDNMKEKDSKLKVREGGNASAASSVSSAGAVSDSKRNLALYKIADSHSNSTKSLVVRGRRQRKQPTLYQPQLCADSQWKSDETKLGTDGNDDDDDHTDSSSSSSSDAETDRDTDNGEKGESKLRHSKSRRVLKTKKADDLKDQIGDNVIICIGEDAVARKKPGSPFCNFCHDDTSILICVFCGCRTCFGKHSRSALLLCDNCDDEYHIQCLGLSTVPSAQKWYCPACDKTKTATRNRRMLTTRRTSSGTTHSSAIEAGSETDNSKHSSLKRKKRSSLTTTRTPPPAATRSADAEVFEKRSRSRPSRFRTENESTPAPSSSPRKRVRTAKEVGNSNEIMEQRKRGRQSKTTPNAPTTPSSGRKRGRPPKNIPSNAPTVLSKSSSSPGARKRGRPPKANSDYEATPSKVDSIAKKKVPKPSTPSSSTTLKKANNTTVSVVATKPQEPIKVSRVSGRTVKRASFHDEVDEGEQHLRASKSPHSGEHELANPSSKAAPSKSQEAQTHLVNSKTPELPEPTRKKQKLEEKTHTQSKTSPGDGKCTKSQKKTSMTVDDKDEEMIDPPPIAPVRMKPVLEPPVAPIAPVRMKPVLEPPAPALRPPISVPEDPKPIEKTVLNAAEDANKSIVVTDSNKEEKNVPKGVVVDAAPTVTKPEGTEKEQPPALKAVTPTINKAATVVPAKATAPPNATPRASPTFVSEIPSSRSAGGASAVPNYPSTPLLDPVALEAAVKALPEPKGNKAEKTGTTKTPRRKPGARECMQISRRFGANIIPEKYMTTLLDYCRRGKVEHLIKMRERLDCHSRFLEYQLAGLEARVKEVGESKIVVPAMPVHKRDPSSRHRGGGSSGSGGVSPPPALNKKAATFGSTTKAPIVSQTSGKKPLQASQAPGTTSSKIRSESTAMKIPVKPTPVPKQTISSTMTIAKTTALPVPLANKTKTS